MSKLDHPFAAAVYRQLNYLRRTDGMPIPRRSPRQRGLDPSPPTDHALFTGRARTHDNVPEAWDGMGASVLAEKLLERARRHNLHDLSPHTRLALINELSRGFT